MRGEREHRERETRNINDGGNKLMNQNKIKNHKKINNITNAREK